MNVTIEKIEIVSFGKLKNAVCTPSAGVNILSAPNESGKSTLAAFIKFVFYGFSGVRMQSLAENEKKLYTPWDSELSEGNITITADGKKYIVYRRCLASGKDVSTVTEYNSGKTVFSGEIPGEVFFGVGEDVFSRTLFFRQLTTPQSKDDILADRLKNIAISADEQVGTKKAVAKLNEAKNELKNKMGNGLIPKAQAERDGLEAAITQSLSLRRKSSELNLGIKNRHPMLQDAENRLEALNVERRNIEKYEALLKLKTINRLSEEEKTAREEYQKIAAALKKHDDGDSFRELFAKNTEYVAECRDSENLTRQLTEAKEELKSIQSEIPFSLAESKKVRKLISSSEKNSRLAFIFGAVFAILGLFIYLASGNPAGFLGIALGVICAAIGGVFISKPAAYAKEVGLVGTSELKNAVANIPAFEKQAKDAEQRIDSLTVSLQESNINCEKLKRELDEGIGRYIDVSGADYSEQIQYILSLSAESGEKLALWRSKKEELDNVCEGIDLSALTEEAKGATPPMREKSKIDRDISFYTAQIAQLSDLNRRDELEYAALEAKSGDPAALIGKRDSLDATISSLTLKHKAYQKAIEVIEESADYMKSMVAPRISRRADEYFSAATGGKYSAFEVDTRLSMSFGEDFRRSCDYLSAGTRDSAYLSLRLALADMLFGGCGVPILLDDAFVRIDDIRLGMIAGVLKEASKKHQIIILTHSCREKDAFDGIGADYNEISISQSIDT